MEANQEKKEKEVQETIAKYRETFWPATFINGIDCSGLSVKEAEKKLISKTDQYTLRLITKEGKQEIVGGDDIEYRVLMEPAVKELFKRQHDETSLWELCQHKNLESQISYQYNKAALREMVQNMEFMQKSNWVAPEDARITLYEEGKYRIVKEVEGNTIDEEKLWLQIAKALSGAKTELSLLKEDCYILPKLTSDSEILVEASRKAQDFICAKVTLHFDNKAEIIEESVLAPLVHITSDYDVEFNKDALSEYVNGLIDQYTTYHKARTFRTSYGVSVSVTGGEYGYRINEEGLKEQIIDSVLNGDEKVIEIDYLQKGAGYAENDLGNTYVEINLAMQHLFYYKDGVLLVESDLVSGNVAKHMATPTGTSAIHKMRRNTVLRGPGYASPVSYWMRFRGGIGLHDATWRSRFGGTIYLRGGSHGCINLPKNVAKTIYENTYIGVPVICYSLSKSQISSSVPVLSGN